MKIKTMIRYYIIPIRMAKLKKLIVSGVGEGLEEPKLLYTAVKNVK